MTESESKALQAKGKSEVVSSAEQTKPGPIFTPAVDIFETEKALILLADMPGVKAKDLTIDLREGVLALSNPCGPAGSTRRGGHLEGISDG